MTFRIADLSPDAIEDAVAYWLYTEDEGWERWRLVPGSPAIAPNGQVLRLAFELDGDRFELALVERGTALHVRYDDHEDPEQELPARLFEADDETIVRFVHKDQTVFLHLELSGA